MNRSERAFDTEFTCCLPSSMSPSRLMAVMDPLLNTGFLWRCLAAYAGIKGDDEEPHDELESATVLQSDDSASTKQRKVDNVMSLPDQSAPESSVASVHKSKQVRPEYVRDDKYYTRLGRRQASLKQHRSSRLSPRCYHGLAASNSPSEVTRIHYSRHSLHVTVASFGRNTPAVSNDLSDCK